MKDFLLILFFLPLLILLIVIGVIMKSVSKFDLFDKATNWNKPKAIALSILLWLAIIWIIIY